MIKASRVERRYLDCTCVAGASGMPLGFGLVTETAMTVAMARHTGGTVSW